MPTTIGKGIGVRAVDSRSRWSARVRWKRSSSSNDVALAIGAESRLHVGFRPVLRASDGLLVGTEAMFARADPREGRRVLDQFAHQPELLEELSLRLIEESAKQLRTALSECEVDDPFVAIRLRPEPFWRDGFATRVIDRTRRVELTGMLLIVNGSTPDPRERTNMRRNYRTLEQFGAWTGTGTLVGLPPEAAHLLEDQALDMAPARRVPGKYVRPLAGGVAVAGDLVATSHGRSDTQGLPSRLLRTRRFAVPAEDGNDEASLIALR